MKLRLNVLRLMLLPLAFTTFSLSSCRTEENIEDIITTPNGKALIENVEIGLNNNEIGTIGEDFHFNADITAEGKIDYVKLDILQRKDETYVKTWSYNVSWDTYKGLKNSNIHKHFIIPANAVEGLYDFVITVYDQSAPATVEKRKVSLYRKENLPVNPSIDALNIMANNDFYYSIAGGYEMPNYTYQSNDVLKGICRISGVKDNGKIYLLLINKKFNHKPETISAIDFSKAIVYGVYEHQNFSSGQDFMTPPDANMNSLVIGSTQDFNQPTPSPISGQKAWESGNYYLGAVYTNTTHNISCFKYIDLKIDY